MKVLHLDIKPSYIEALLSGRKQIEVREVRPKNAFILLDKNNRDLPRHYDAICYHSEEFGKAADVLVSIVNIDIRNILNSFDEPIEYEYKGHRFKAVEIIYQLGAILKAPKLNKMNIV